MRRPEPAAAARSPDGDRLFGSARGGGGRHGAVACASLFAFADVSFAQGTASPPIWTVPEIGALPNDANGQLVRRGRDLVTATYAHIGPEVADPAKRFAGNNLACSNCHLNAGTKMFGIALFGLFGEFPQYSARPGAEITIEDRLNSCMARSMNGRAAAGRRPRDAGLRRLHQVSVDRRGAGRILPGLGVGKMPELGAPPIRCAAAASTRATASPATTPTAAASAAACRPPISAT